MGLPFSMPPHIANAKEAWRHAIHIECFGLDTECLGGMLVDDRFWLEGFEASSSFFIIPMNVGDPPRYADAAFYADCIAFEHEFSTLAVPRAELLSDDEIPWEIFSRAKQASAAARYVEWLIEGCEVANRVNLGIERQVVFKYDWLYFDAPPDGIVKIGWSAMFKNVGTAIHLYNAALRQLDPLTQFLCFYRVVENITGNNGKGWVESTLPGPMDYKGPVWCVKTRRSIKTLIGKAEYRRVRLKRFTNNRGYFNVLEVTRAKALQRLATLRREGSDADIAKRLYNGNRCGIAHGSDIRRHDLSDDFRNIVQDLPLIRFLARLAIEEVLAVPTPK